jgi:hypothetical protein
VSEMDQGDTVAPEQSSVTPAPHTPGPWRIIVGDDYYIAADEYPKEFIGHFKGDDNGQFIACVGNRPKDFGEANARLIAAAPALLEALQKAHAWMLSAPEDGDPKKFRADIKEISDAISAAKGET